MARQIKINHQPPTTVVANSTPVITEKPVVFNAEVALSSTTEIRLVPKIFTNGEVGVKSGFVKLQELETPYLSLTLGTEEPTPLVEGGNPAANDLHLIYFNPKIPDIKASLVHPNADGSHPNNPNYIFIGAFRTGFSVQVGGSGNIRGINQVDVMNKFRYTYSYSGGSAGYKDLDSHSNFVILPGTHIRAEAYFDMSASIATKAGISVTIASNNTQRRKNVNAGEYSCDGNVEYKASAIAAIGIYLKHYFESGSHTLTNGPSLIRITTTNRI